uniref:Uncharacterized protein n=1 Tax=Mandrillus leucophaeus TaxID=9568 RepID=A0A2K5ZUG9_MANLE
MPLQNTKASQGTGREMMPVSWGRRGLLPGSGSAGGTVNQSWHPHPGQRAQPLSRLQGCHLLSPQAVWPLWSVLGIRFSSRALASCLLFNWEHGLSQDQNPHSPLRSYLASL